MAKSTRYEIFDLPLDSDWALGKLAGKEVSMPKVLKSLETPNPLARRFLVDTILVEQGSCSFPNVESAQADRTAAKLFEIPFVTSVFYVGSTVTVNIDEDANWDALLTPIADILEETLLAISISAPFGTTETSQSLTDPNSESQTKSKAYEASAFTTIEDFFDWPPTKQLGYIETILDAEIRPGLARDGGGLELIGIEAHVVKVHYAGACGSCPSSQSGTLMYVEGVLQRLAHPDLMVVVE